MEQLEIFDIPSPCTGVCQLNSNGYCIGCYRSRQERLHWRQLTNIQRRNVLRLCLQRQVRYIKESKPDDLPSACYFQPSLFHWPL